MIFWYLKESILSRLNDIIVQYKLKLVIVYFL